MSKLILWILLLMFCFINFTSASNVLVIFAYPSRSHNILGESLSRGLAKAGHNVTFIGAYEQTEFYENVTNLVLNGMEEALFEELARTKIYTMFDLEGNPLKQGFFLNRLGVMIVNFTMSHPLVKKLILSKPKFDVIVLEQFTADGLKYLASYFDTPLIMFSSIGSNKWLNALVGNPAPPSFVPDTHTLFSNEMNFFERLQNFIFGICLTISWHYLALAPQSDIIKKQFPNGPDFYDCLHNISIVLVNAHESFVEPVPQVPSMINIGGFHVNPTTKQLPSDLKNYISNAKYGVIYFNMGSIIRPWTMPNSTLKAILETLNSRKERVVFHWKSENYRLIAQHYSNIMFVKWLPQQDLLAHPNIKIFITHGGLLSITEAIYHGVPMLVLPVASDQPTNGARIVKWKIGRSIPFSKINNFNLREALNDVLSNSEYKANAVYRSKLFHDRPVKPMDLATYWIDYVIRHKGAPHLRVAGADLAWYQYIMLDVFAVLLLFLAIVFYLLRKIIALVNLRKRIKIKQT